MLLLAVLERNTGLKKGFSFAERQYIQCWMKGSYTAHLQYRRLLLGHHWGVCLNFFNVLLS